MLQNVESAVEPLVLTIREAAQAAHISERMVRKLISSRRLAVVRIGRAVRVPRSELLRLCGAQAAGMSE